MPTLGTIKPEDETARLLNKAASQVKNGQYIWPTVGDEKVRKTHAELNGTIRDFADRPDPTEEPNCRCWVEQVAYSYDEDDKNQICIDLHNTYEELKNEMAAIPEKMFFARQDLKDAQEQLKKMANRTCASFYTYCAFSKR